MKDYSLQFQPTKFTKGFSLVEITVVVALMLGLVTMVTYSVTSMNNWKMGRSASEALQSVYVAQRSFLADHPTKDSSDFTLSALSPYLPGQSTSMPQAKSLDNAVLTLDYTSMPPVWKLAGSTYDPSDDPTDGVWDVGNLNSFQNGGAGPTASATPGSTGSGDADSLSEIPLSEG